MEFLKNKWIFSQGAVLASAFAMALAFIACGDDESASSNPPENGYAGSCAEVEDVSLHTASLLPCEEKNEGFVQKVENSSFEDCDSTEFFYKCNNKKWLKTSRSEWEEYQKTLTLESCTSEEIGEMKDAGEFTPKYVQCDGEYWMEISEADYHCYRENAQVWDTCAYTVLTTGDSGIHMQSIPYTSNYVAVYTIEGWRNISCDSSEVVVKSENKDFYYCDASSSSWNRTGHDALMDECYKDGIQKGDSCYRKNSAEMYIYSGEEDWERVNWSYCSDELDGQIDLTSKHPHCGSSECACASNRWVTMSDLKSSTANEIVLDGEKWYELSESESAMLSECNAENEGLVDSVYDSHPEWGSVRYYKCEGKFWVEKDARVTCNNVGASVGDLCVRKPYCGIKKVTCGWKEVFVYAGDGVWEDYEGDDVGDDYACNKPISEECNQENEGTRKEHECESNVTTTMRYYECADSKWSQIDEVTYFCDVGTPAVGDTCTFELPDSTGSVKTYIYMEESEYEPEGWSSL